MSKVYVGIDIGKSGAIATYYPDKKIFTLPMPLIKNELDYVQLAVYLNALKEAHADVHVVFEKLGLVFGSSKKTAWSMGEQSGAVEMACIALKIPYTKIRPVDWQKDIFSGVPEMTKTPKPGSKTGSRDTKAMALVAIKRLFPNLTLNFGGRAVKPDDGLIDAVLLAEYGRRRNL